MSIILQTATRFLITVLLILPVFLFVRGHNEPGGGFVAGLVAAIAVVLYAIAFDVSAARRLVRVDPRLLIGLGILFSLVSGLLGLLRGQPYMTGNWGVLDFPGFPVVDLGTPLMFDFGVFLAVLGVALTIILALMEE